MFPWVLSLLLSGGLTFVPLDHCRILDTRLVSAGALHDGDYRGIRFQAAHADCTIPQGTAAVFVNISAVNPSGAGHLRMGRVDRALPSSAVITFGAHTASNQALLRLPVAPPCAGLDDVLALATVVNSGSVHLVLDVQGYWIADPPPCSP
jgi:hypothetical protein